MNIEDIIGKLDDKYINETISYTPKKHNSLSYTIKIIAACLCVFCIVFVTSIFVEMSIQNETTSSYTGDLPPMIFVNDKLYKHHKGVESNVLNENYRFIGTVKSCVDSSLAPSVNFQANDKIIGAKIYQQDENLIIVYNDNYMLYRLLD